MTFRQTLKHVSVFQDENGQLSYYFILNKRRPRINAAIESRKME